MLLWVVAFFVFVFILTSANSLIRSLISPPSQKPHQTFGSVSSKTIFALRFAKPVPKFYDYNAQITRVLVPFQETKTPVFSLYILEIS